MTVHGADDIDLYRSYAARSPKSFPVQPMSDLDDTAAAYDVPPWMPEPKGEGSNWAVWLGAVVICAAVWWAFYKLLGG